MVIRESVFYRTPERVQKGDFFIRSFWIVSGISPRMVPFGWLYSMAAWGHPYNPYGQSHTSLQLKPPKTNLTEW